MRPVSRIYDYPIVARRHIQEGYQIRYDPSVGGNCSIAPAHTKQRIPAVHLGNLQDVQTISNIPLGHYNLGRDYYNLYRSNYTHPLKDKSRLLCPASEYINTQPWPSQRVPDLMPTRIASLV